MEFPCILPIVEGHGEEQAIRLLIQRIGTQLLDISYIEVLKPIRVPKNQMLKPAELGRYVELASRKLLQEQPNASAKCIMIIFDADDDLPCQVAPQVLEGIQRLRDGLSVSCVIASKMYETWFVASADFMPEQFGHVESDVASSAEDRGLGKHWVKDRSLRSYSETADMPRLTRLMNLEMVRARSRSFDKLCREIESIVGLGSM